MDVGDNSGGIEIGDDVDEEPQPLLDSVRSEWAMPLCINRPLGTHMCYWIAVLGGYVVIGSVGKFSDFFPQQG